MKYEVYKADDYMTEGGKPYKKVVLQEEGKQYPYKNVTVWSSYPPKWDDYTGFDMIKAGVTIEGSLEEKDSGTPNPKSPGKNYINRTFIPIEIASEVKVEENQTLEAWFSIFCDVTNRRMDDLELLIKGAQKKDPEEPF